MYRVVVTCDGQSRDGNIEFASAMAARKRFSEVIKSLGGMNCDIHKSVTGLHSAYLWNDEFDVSVRIERAS